MHHHAEHRNASLPDPFDFRNGLFYLLRIEVAATAYDDVFDPTGYENLATGHVGAVAAVEPAAVEQVPRLRLVAKIAGRRTWPAKLQPPLVPVSKFDAQLIDDADLVARKR